MSVILTSLKKLRAAWIQSNNVAKRVVRIYDGDGKIVWPTTQIRKTTIFNQTEIEIKF